MCVFAEQLLFHVHLSTLLYQLQQFLLLCIETLFLSMTCVLSEYNVHILICAQTGLDRSQGLSHDAAVGRLGNV